MKRFLSFINKYHDKLNAAAKTKGFTSVEAMIIAHKPKVCPTVSVPSMTNKTSSNVDLTKMNMKQIGKRKLDQILNLDKIKDLKSESISEIWNSYLSNYKGSLSASLSSEIWAKKVLNLTKYPSYIISMPHNESFTFYFMEFSNDSIYVTKLEEYQNKGSLAKPDLELHFYTDLLLVKDLVLLKADIMDESLSLKDAQYLIYQIQYWYYIGGAKTLGIISKFHNDPKGFDYKWITEYDYFK